MGIEILTVCNHFMCIFVRFVSEGVKSGLACFYMNMATLLEICSLFIKLAYCMVQIQ